MNEIGTAPRSIRMLRECAVSCAPALLLAAACVALLAVLGLGALLP